MKSLCRVKISKVLASNLVHLREKNGLSVQDLAKLCGISRQGVYHIESGEKWISMPLIEKICSIYKIEQHELFQVNLIKKDKSKLK
jgi:transcriptional regulator with XRE-family HTH domain